MVEKFGGVVKLITPPNVDSVSEAMGNIDGLMLAGGADVHPKHYGEDSDADCWYNEDLDDLEIPILESALETNLPILAICRGMQVLNVSMGGSLIQHINGHDTEQVEGDDRRSSYHRIFLSPGSKLSATVGSGGFVRVNHRHHQGIAEAQKSDDLMASAWSMEDGLIEALESPNHRWVLGKFPRILINCLKP
jgi:putative glutamine amidotransferase